MTSTLRHSSSPGRGGLIRQLPSHAHLLDDVSRSTTSFRRGRPDAIVVPSSRPASALTGLIDLAADLEAPLVVLCSHQAKFDQVHQRMMRHHRSRGLVVQIGNQANNRSLLELETSAEEFLAAGAGRRSTLSVKRNIGLLLARLLGWTKIVFLDDDIDVTAGQIARLTAHLDHHQIAGMVCRDFPDNSVLCHARRLARLPQDNFVTGAVLGVNCDGRGAEELFFPDIYNEDWFFFGEAAAGRRLAKVGEAGQAEYLPFEKQSRAEHEEFGDLLAEGLYSLFETAGIESFDEAAEVGSPRYWAGFIAARQENVFNTIGQLETFQGRENCNDDVDAAITSLLAAATLYDLPATGDVRRRIDADLCVRYLDELRGDRKLWRDFYLAAPRFHGEGAAMSWLGISNWMPVRSPLAVHG